MNDRIVVIGGGPAGVEAASTAASYGKEVTLVSDGPVGTWHQLMPSRVWLHVLDNLQTSLVPAAYRARNSLDSSSFDLKAVASYVNEIAEQWNAQHVQRLTELGVRIVEGKASFRSANQLFVSNACEKEMILQANAIIVATGSIPVVPNHLAPDGRRVFSPGTAHEMSFLPDSIVVIGDGPPGFEFVHIFSLLNIDVTWLVLGRGPSCGVIPEADAYLVDMLRQRRVTIVPGEPVAELARYEDHIVAVRPDGRCHRAEMAFVTIGNRPNSAPLNLEDVGVKVDGRGFVCSDGYGQTNVEGIYVAGDARKIRSGSVSMAQARIAALHAAAQAVEPYDEAGMVISFLSNPQVAKVGVLSAADESICSVEVALRAGLKTHIAGNTDGFIRLAWNQDRAVVGGMALGYQAADALAPVALAIKTDTTIDEFASIYGPHPTMSELPFLAARAACIQAQ